MIKGAIFDVDGTLLDSMGLWDDIGVNYLRSLGFEPKEDLRETFKISTLYEAADYLRTHYPILKTTEEIEDGINLLAENFYKNEAPLKENVENLLSRLYENGVKMCIATSTDKYHIEAALARLGIDKYFSEIFTCTDVGHGKDEPVIYQKALSHLNSEKQKTVVFEDALYAIKTVKSEGFTVVTVYDESSLDEQEEIKKLSDFHINDFKNLDSVWDFLSQI